MVLTFPVSNREHQALSFSIALFTVLHHIISPISRHPLVPMFQIYVNVLMNIPFSQLAFHHLGFYFLHAPVIILSSTSPTNLPFLYDLILSSHWPSKVYYFISLQNLLIP